MLRCVGLQFVPMSTQNKKVKRLSGPHCIPLSPGPGACKHCLFPFFFSFIFSPSLPLGSTQHIPPLCTALAFPRGWEAFKTRHLVSPPAILQHYSLQFAPLLHPAEISRGVPVRQGTLWSPGTLSLQFSQPGPWKRGCSSLDFANLWNKLLPVQIFSGWVLPF